MMNCNDANRLWDAHRDGELSDADRQAFERHVTECDRCAMLWRRETQYLAALTDVPADSPHRDFVSRVLQRWRRQSERSPVLARITRWSIAAAAAVAIAATMWVMLPRTTPAPIGPVAKGDGVTDPVSVLVLEVSESLDREPARVRRTWRKTTAALDLNELVSLLDPAGPQPSDRANGVGPQQRG